MRGLKARGSFVENRSVIPKSGRKSGIYLVFIAAVIVGGIAVIGSMGQSLVSVSNSGGYSYDNFRSVENDLGVGNNTPAISIDIHQHVFTIAWYGYNTHNGQWYLNTTIISSGDGSIIGTQTITTDIEIYYGKPFKYGPQIAYDPDDGGYILIWYSANKSLDGALLDDHGQLYYGPFVINSTATHVSPNAFGLSYAGNHQFNVVWSTTSYRSYFRAVMVDTSSSPPVTLGSEVQISADNAMSHVNHAVATDTGEGATMVAWRNSTGTSGKYNITGKIFDAGMATVYKNDFTIADGLTDGKHYDFPNVAAGSGEFFVVYGNYNSPYDVNGKILASDGTLIKSIHLLNSSSAIRYYGIGVAYNGSGGFVVTLPDPNRNIIAMLYDTSGNLVWLKTIIADGNSNEGARVAVDPAGYNNEPTYQFVWYDYSNGMVRTSWWQESELIPELNPILPIIAVLFAVIAMWRRRI